MKNLITLFALLTLTAVAGRPVANAETLCGTVSDSETQSPVDRAGIFVFFGGAYTGLHAATDTAGLFCIEPIAPGIYDLQVKVNDYETMWVIGVVVDASTVSVDIHPRSSALHLNVWPNPASSLVHLRFQSPGERTVSVTVYDIRGRLVHGWRGRANGDETELRWNLKDTAGQELVPGVYFVRLHAGSEVLTRKLVLTP